VKDEATSTSLSMKSTLDRLALRNGLATCQLLQLIHQVCREIWNYQTPLPVAFVGRYLLEPLWLRGYRDVLTVTVSESSKDSLENYGLTRVVVVPEGHHSAGKRPDVPRESRPTIVFVGRLRQINGR